MCLYCRYLRGALPRAAPRELAPEQLRVPAQGGQITNKKSTNKIKNIRRNKNNQKRKPYKEIIHINNKRTTNSDLLEAAASSHLFSPAHLLVLSIGLSRCSPIFTDLYVRPRIVNLHHTIVYYSIVCYSIVHI